MEHNISTVLVLGGARSGKSRHAQKLAESARPDRVFIATAEALDQEMADRIQRHIADRDASWETLEAPLELAGAIRLACESRKSVLVDCLTLWLSNLMHAELNINDATEELVESLTRASSPLVFVSNEVGMGIVPESPMARAFRDEQGRLNQRMAEVCARVDFVAAGLPITLKP